VPDVTDGALRAVFFFSFFGLMVSELGLVRILPLGPPAGPPTATWGIELTVSVSTVIFLVDPSPDGFPLPAPTLKDFEVGPLGRTTGGGATEVDRILISPFPPLSLPLSLARRLGFDLSDMPACSIGFSSVNVDVPFAALSNAPSSEFPGVFGWLISCTVSNVEVPPLAPLAGVLMPGTANVSSASLSVAVLPSCCSVECDTLCTLMP